MDAYDQYQAMGGAGQGTNDRMNKLKAYMALYSSSGMGQGGVSTTDPGGVPRTYYDIGNGARSRNAMDWATGQLDNEVRQNQTDQISRQFSQPHDFYGQQPQYAQQQYVQPNSQQQQQNPFTNYLRQMMGSGPRGQFTGNATQGVRG